MESELSLQGLHVVRKIYTTQDLIQETSYKGPTKKNVSQELKKRCCHFSCSSCIFNSVPILKWLPEYQWKKDIIKDLISGLTVAVMHIPQGMAYALLGNVPPIIGVYMAFFPVLIYVIFGTSRHVSMGTFALVCLMTGKVVHEHSTYRILQNGTMLEKPDIDPNGPKYTNIDVASTVTFVVAMMQLLMYALRLGVISTLLSDTLVSGFTCGSAFHVVSSQLRDLFGLPIKKRRGYFSFVLTLYDSILALPYANTAAVTTSAITVSLLIFNDKIVKPQVKKITIFPLPIELLAVSLGTLASYLMNLQEVYDVSIVGHIPTGLPYPALPKFQLMPLILLDSFVITMVSYSITVSMGLIFARMLHYEIDFNQELLAMGLSNIFGSFFSTMPVTASLSRSMIQQSVGGVTQLASIVSCCILLLVLLWIGPVFENLPRCVLASIITVALWSMIRKVALISKYWKLSRWDALVWLVTFGVTVFIQISLGLAAGIATAIYSVFMQGHNPHSCILGAVPDTDIYLNIKRHPNVREIDSIKIFRFTGGISFLSKAVFKEHLCRKIGFDPAKILRMRMKMESEFYDEEPLKLKYIILDFSSVTFIDPTGVSMLHMIQEDFDGVAMEMFITGCSDSVYETFLKVDKENDKRIQFSLFPTVHDAVLCAQRDEMNKIS